MYIYTFVVLFHIICATLYYLDHLAVAFLCLLTLLRAATLNPGRVPFSEEDFNNLGTVKSMKIGTA